MQKDTYGIGVYNNALLSKKVTFLGNPQKALEKTNSLEVLSAKIMVNLLLDKIRYMA